MGMFRIVKSIRWLDKYLELSLVVAGLAGMVVVMTVQIVMRSLLGSYLPWSEELCRHLFIYIGFWGISLSLKENSAIKFDLFLSALSKRTQKTIRIFGNIVILAYFLYILKDSISLAKTMLSSATTTLPYSMGLIYWIVVFAFIMIIFRLVQTIVREITDWKE